MNIKTALASPLILVLLAGCATDDGFVEETYLTPEEQKAATSDYKPPQAYGFPAFPEAGGIGFDGAARLHPNHMASTKMKEGGLPVIEMRGRAPRHTFDALLDFSSPTSWLEFSMAEELGARFLGLNNTPIPYRGNFNTGRVNAFAGVVSQLRIDQLFLEDVPFYVRMARGSLGPLARGIYRPNVEAVLGYDNLQVFEYIRMDPASGTIVFSATIPYQPHPDLLMAEAKIRPLNGFGLAVDGAIFGDPTPILLDFAGDYHFARGDVKVPETRQVSIGDLVYRKVPTLMLPANDSPPRAGRKMLENYVVTICARLGTVYFERIPEE